MASCDDLYNKIQQLQEKKRRYDEAASYVYSASEEAPDPSRVFVTKTKDGKQIEVDFDELWARAMADPATREWALKAASRGDKPVGSEGYFENLGQLVERLGFDDAVTTATFLQKLTGNWAKSDPVDFNMITARNSGEAWEGQIAQAFRDAGIDASDKLVQAVTVNAAPFLDILNKQSKLRVFSYVARNNLQKTITQIQDFVNTNGIGAPVELKQQFTSDYRKAMYAHRSERLASRRSGQLLQNYQRFFEGEQTVQGVMPDLSDPKAQKRFNDMMTATTGQSSEELVAMTRETVGVTVDEMVREDSLIRRVLEAADKGPAAAKDLEDIQKTLNLEGLDGFGEDSFDDGWDKIWKKHARAGYKDTVLFNPKTQLQSNYLSQKIVFLTEGYITASSQGWDLMARRSDLRRRETQLGTTPDANTELEFQPTTGFKIQPVATGFYREALKAQLDGARIAGKAGLVANDVIRQSWKESIQKGFFEGNTPFSGNVDNFANQGTLSIDQQYKVAESALSEPMSRDPRRWPMQLRNKMHHALKVKANQGIQAAGGSRLPVYSSLQMMSAVDQRAGLRNYMTVRANDLMLDAAAANPDGTLKEWADVAARQMEDQLYQAEPTAQNIADAREQFGLTKEELTDDEVAAYIVGTKVGAPVLNTPERAFANRRATEMRMQGQVGSGDGWTAGARTAAKGVDQVLRGIRTNQIGDTLVPFWRSPANQIVWDMMLGTAPLRAGYHVLEIAGYAVKGKEVPKKLLVDAQASIFTAGAILTMFAALDSQGLIEGGGPMEPTARRNYRERLKAEGKVPNSILGIPFPMNGIPVLNTLFLYKDLKEVISSAVVSEYDQRELAWGVVSLIAGTIMRMPGFAQVNQLFEIFNSPSAAKVQQLAAYWLNTNFNPVSGGERLAEWAAGTQSSSMYRPARTSKAEEFRLKQLGEEHPLRKLDNNLREWAYYSNPGLAYWAGGQIQEKTWLGRDIRRPDGIFRGEWPVGVPGIFEFNKGEYFVEEQLEILGMLDPPPMIMNNELAGIPLVSGGDKELNQILGSYRAPKAAGFSSQTRSKTNGLVYPLPVAEQSLSKTQPGGIPETQPLGKDMTAFMDKIVSGRTVREALNALLTSKEWETWRTDPALSWDPRIVDMPPTDRKNKIGPWMVKQIKDHYADMAAKEFQLSASKPAQQWREDKENLRVSLPEQQGLYQTLTESLEAAIP